MGRYALLWLLGVPIPILLLIYLVRRPALGERQHA